MGQIVAYTQVGSCIKYCPKAKVSGRYQSDVDSALPLLYNDKALDYTRFAMCVLKIYGV